MGLNCYKNIGIKCGGDDMNANEVNVVIDNICSKIGIAAGNVAEIIPEFARMRMVSNIIWAIALFFFVVISSIAACKYKDVLLILIALLCATIMVICIIGAVEWGIAPQAKMIEYVLSKLQS